MGAGEATGAGVAVSLYLPRIHDVWRQKLHIPITRRVARHVRGPRSGVTVPCHRFQSPTALKI